MFDDKTCSKISNSQLHLLSKKHLIILVQRNTEYVRVSQGSMALTKTFKFILHVNLYLYLYFSNDNFDIHFQIVSKFLLYNRDSHVCTLRC